MPDMPLRKLTGGEKDMYVEMTDADAFFGDYFEPDHPPGQKKIKREAVVDPFPFDDPQYLAACERLKIFDARTHFRCFGYPAVRGDWLLLG